MIITCPNCGSRVEVRHLGRPPLNIPFTNVCDALQRAKNIMGAAMELRCSPAYVYKILHSNGLSIKDVLERS